MVSCARLPVNKILESILIGNWYFLRLFPAIIHPQPASD
jgi:hypothetical protein